MKDYSDIDGEILYELMRYAFLWLDDAWFIASVGKVGRY